jgi:hypothetical protein
MILASICSLLLDYMPPTMYWSGNYAGYEYYDEKGTTPVHSYPIQQMLDGDMSTAWMVDAFLRPSKAGAPRRSSFNTWLQQICRRFQTEQSNHRSFFVSRPYWR